MTPPDIHVPVGPILAALNIVGTFVFAASGALAAARLRQTLVTFAFFALTTGVGGGTVRDLLIGAPVFWVHDVSQALICLGAALIVFMTPVRWWPERMLDWLDAIGLAAFAVFGTAKAISYGIHPLIAALMGVSTACVGGIIRDLLAGVPSILLRPEIYVTAAALSAGLYALLLSLGAPAAPAGALAALAGFALRALAIARGLALPSYGEGPEGEPAAPPD
ncbi:trimeric intracellular cation channel family protein [Sphingobium nicotianae]|uniref:Trimeric intracellular cation channel family protein n=1 Tax=Sphingobium nicotianae TaxID=2782607 RepID=A0A9X1DEP4_9SPHN|nr:trimeric intracellular cation channel family protein [Sphingobium nicotianae]MBT2188681.1 trimeric intracellular cation channel family protein [Sphingobium nicotianae]